MRWSIHYQLQILERLASFEASPERLHVLDKKHFSSAPIGKLIGSLSSTALWRPLCILLVDGLVSYAASRLVHPMAPVALFFSQQPAHICAVKRASGPLQDMSTTEQV